MEVYNPNENVENIENVEKKEQMFVKEDISYKENIRENETLETNGPTLGNAEETEDNRREENKEHSNSSSNSSGSASSVGSIAAGATAGFVAITIILATVIANIVASFISIVPYGNSFDFVVEIAFDIEAQADVALDFANIDTNTFLMVYNNKFSLIVPLKTNFEGDENGTKMTSVVEYKLEKEKTYKTKITFTGTVVGLSPNTRYKTEIFGYEKNNKKIYSTSTFKTTGEKTVFNNVEYQCLCMIDGNLYFNLNYLDENNYFSNFKYELIDAMSKQIVASGDIQNPKDKQKINVSELTYNQYILKISYNSLDPGDIQRGKTNIVVEINIKL